MSSDKTPVSTLHELFMVKGITPYYELIVNGVGTHNPFFKYRLECGDVVSFGSGKSKKEAKHDAALNALNQLKYEGKATKVCEEKIQTDGANNPVESPYQDVVKENVVGTLATLCATNRISEPVYELIGEEGPPHCKTFTIQCCVLHLKEVSQARTKKQAKHKSSKQMIDKLQEYFNNSLDFAALTDEFESSQPAASAAEAKKREEAEIEQIRNKYVSVLKNRPVVEHFGLDIKDYYTINAEAGINAHLLHPNFDSLKSANLQEIDDPHSYALSLFDGLDCELTWRDEEVLNGAGFIKSVTVGTSPNWSFMGASETEEKAIRACCLSMLDFFQTLMK